ncbi:helix-turn-helix domain-containing protein [Arcanobacterium phocae]|uniref:helix-turn-helix domain-containing protein n=1 Tax=Arcanobacterium phocae TaxID=131112 RepID=UPI001C0F2EF2|nr:ImmA/IrrE family metallo-endopeptidase [Arcanobacterium phocae]
MLLADRITTARQLRQLSKTDFAGLLGVTVRTVTNYEMVGAPDNKKAIISKVLGFPEGFFFQDGLPQLEKENVEFRSFRSTPAREKHAALAHSKIGIELMNWVGSKFRLPSPNIPSLSGMEPTEAANVLRQVWGLGSKPLPNLVQLCESRGIHVLGLDKEAKSVDAVSFWHDEGAYIFLGRNKTPERTRFDLAHELGHLVLHEDHDGFSEREYEAEADAFASEFLLPRVAQIEYVVNNPSLAQIMKYKASFGMSAFATVRALHDSERLSDWAYRSLCVELSKRGFRTDEPGSRLSYENSKVFSTILSADSSGKYTVRTIANQMFLPSTTVRTLMMTTDMRIVEPVGKNAGDVRSVPSGNLVNTSSGKLRLVK